MESDFTEHPDDFSTNDRLPVFADGNYHIIVNVQLLSAFDGVDTILFSNTPNTITHLGITYFIYTIPNLLSNGGQTQISNFITR